MSTVQILDVGQLKVRPDYQRRLDEHRVRRMAAAFDERLAGALEVSEDQGSYWVVDGQHRLAAMRLAKRTKAQTIVHRGLSLQDEAELFARLNTDRRAVTPNALYRAELVAGNPRATSIATTLASYELTAGQHSKRSIQSIGTLYQLYKTEMLEPVLRLVSEAWVDGEGTPIEMALDGRVLSSIGRFLREAGLDEKFDESHFRQVLMRHRPDELIREARGYSSFAVGAQLALIRWYNYKLQSQYRLAE